MKELRELINEYTVVKRDLHNRMNNIFPYLSSEHIDDYVELYNEIMESDIPIDIISILDYYICDACDLFRLNRDAITNITYYDSTVAKDHFYLILKFDTTVNEEDIGLEFDVYVSHEDLREDYYVDIYLHNKSNDLKCKLNQYEAEKYHSKNYNIIDIINDKNLCKTFSDFYNCFYKADEFIRKNIKFDNIDVVVNNDNRSNITYSLSKVFEKSDSNCMSRIIKHSFNKLAFIDSSLRKKKAECTNIIFIKKESSNDVEYIRFMITFKIDGTSYDILTDCYYLYKDEFSSQLFKITKEDK